MSLMKLCPLFAAALAAFVPLTSFAQTPSTETAPVAIPVAPATSAAPTPVGTPPLKITYNQCNVDGPYIAMTFDDGPSAENTPRLLDMLKQRKLKATFFVVGQCAAEFPQIMKRIVDEGHEVASHSWSHPNLGKMGEGSVTDQLQRTHDIIEKTTGRPPTVMRPPYGSFTANQKSWVHKKWGYKVIMWDVDPLDWKYRNASRVHEAILRSTVAGSIILAHDIHKTTVDAMPKTFDDLMEKGFKFVTVSELLAMDRPSPPKPKATPIPKPAAEDPPVPDISAPPADAASEAPAATPSATPATLPVAAPSRKKPASSKPVVPSTLEAKPE